MLTHLFSTLENIYKYMNIFTRGFYTDIINMQYIVSCQHIIYNLLYKPNVSLYSDKVVK